MNRFYILLVVAVLNTSISHTYAQTNWAFVRQTSLRGSISGTITRGHVFKISSNEFYVMTDRNRQRVRVRNPEVKIFESGTDFKLIIEDFDEPVICKKLNGVIQSSVDGEFNGWEGETIYKLANGQVWQQSSYAYIYHYAYSPEVLIYKFDGSYLMSVEDVGETVEVKQLTKSNSTSTSDVIETHIDGEFKGWEGETIFKLQNGQIWQQSSYSYHYHYAYSPKVLIYKTSNGYEMQVNGVTNKIRVKRIK